VSIALFLYSITSPKISLKKYLIHTDKKVLLTFLFIAIIYWISHLWNFNSAPWNAYGLFDDAAWDIYFANDKIFTGMPFQAAFFDQVGLISRETVFHYYITVFFKLFGYNLLVFNFSLLLLGFITVLFTALIIHKLFGNLAITLIMGIVINFFPLHYMHVFMGHRYAIIAPLMTMSLFFLYSAYLDNSVIKSSLSAIFASLCLSSAIMGKQYILGLIMAAFAILILNFSAVKSKKNIVITISWITAFIISASPLVLYIFYNADAYFGREQGLLNEFFILYNQGGFLALEPFYSQVKDLFFEDINYRRQFLHDYPIIPMQYYLLLVPGLFIAFINKRFEIVFISLLPILVIFLSGAYDFRVLIAAPAWIISMAYGMNYFFEFRKHIGRQILMSITLISTFLGVVPSIMYLFDVSKDPNYVYLLPHKDVAASRMIQDIVAGDRTPSIEMKYNELKRDIPSNIAHDTLVCPNSAYAIAHLYLQKFDDEKVLSLCDQGIQLLKNPNEIIQNNYNAISNYKSVGRDLKLVWEISGKSEEAIALFSKYKRYGNEMIYTGNVDDRQFSLYVLTIDSENTDDFKQEVLGDSTYEI
jgi:hypothetical protein